MIDLDIKELLRCNAKNAPSIDKYIIDLGDLKVDPASFESETNNS